MENAQVNRVGRDLPWPGRPHCRALSYGRTPRHLLVGREAIRRDKDAVGPAEEALARTLASLLYELPASPQVRGAAYRALATLPPVWVEGRTTDPRGRSGVAVTFLIQGDRTPRIRLIIDPDTSKVLTFEVAGVPEKGVNVVLESGWTDTKPSPPSTE